MLLSLLNLNIPLASEVGGFRGKFKSAEELINLNWGTWVTLFFPDKGVDELMIVKSSVCNTPEMLLLEGLQFGL